MIRFDDLTREERYYSATILPYLLAYNNFQGLTAFEEELLKSRMISSISPINESIQIISEIYLERDLPYYRIDIPSSAFKRKMKMQTKPDLLVISDNSLYLFECKVFTNESEYRLHQQILHQQYVFDIIQETTQHSFENKLHFLILPYEYDISDSIVITWERMLNIMAKIIPANNYFLKRLEAAVLRLKTFI